MINTRNLHLTADHFYNYGRQHNDRCPWKRTNGSSIPTQQQQPPRWLFSKNNRALKQHCKTIRFFIISYATSHWYERTVFFFSQSSKWETKNTKLAGKCSHLLHLLWLTTCSKTSSFQIRKSMSNNLKENWIGGLTQIV